jgi:hypothetical protein
LPTKEFSAERTFYPESNLGHEVVVTEYFVEEATYKMYIFVANL